MSGPVRMILVGAPATEFRLAAELARDAGAEAATADTGDQALELLRSQGGDFVMIDVAGDVAGFIAGLRSERFTLPVLACGIDATAEQAVAAIRAGARDYVPLPPQRELIAAAIASVIEHREQECIGTSAAFSRAVTLARALAPSHSPLLLTGDTGCGKEMMARLIHQASGHTGAFVAAECAGVAPEVLESELFGHEAGAFPGAVGRRIGKFEEARGGTVLLREIGLLPPMLQSRLIAAIRDQQFTRAGGTEMVPFEARLVASSCLDLIAMTSQGRFRADLLARFGLLRIEIPALRARGDDVVQLARHFAERCAANEGVSTPVISDTAAAALLGYGWPDNVRELEETIHRAVLLARGGVIGADHLIRRGGELIAEAVAEQPAETLAVEPLVGHTVEEVERELILQTLDRCQGNRTSASHMLGISVRTMRNKLRTFIEAGIAVAPAP